MGAHKGQTFAGHFFALSALGEAVSERVVSARAGRAAWCSALPDASGAPAGQPSAPGSRRLGPRDEVVEDRPNPGRHAP
eukprot:2520047-Pyramimonas_sp.AAC.1